jgi:hypothetical protein
MSRITYISVYSVRLRGSASSEVISSSNGAGRRRLMSTSGLIRSRRLQAAAVHFQRTFSRTQRTTLTDSMAKVKLGRTEFDVDCKDIDTLCSGATCADFVMLAARIKTGEISRVERLLFVRFVFCFIGITVSCTFLACNRS